MFRRGWRWLDRRRPGVPACRSINARTADASACVGSSSAGTARRVRFRRWPFDRESRRSSAREEARSGSAAGRMPASASSASTCLRVLAALLPGERHDLGDLGLQAAPGGHGALCQGFGEPQIEQLHRGPGGGVEQCRIGCEIRFDGEHRTTHQVSRICLALAWRVRWRCARAIDASAGSRCGGLRRASGAPAAPTRDARGSRRLSARVIRPRRPRRDRRLPRGCRCPTARRQRGHRERRGPAGGAGDAGLDELGECG